MSVNRYARAVCALLLSGTLAFGNTAPPDTKSYRAHLDVTTEHDVTEPRYRWMVQGVDENGTPTKIYALDYPVLFSGETPTPSRILFFALDGPSYHLQCANRNTKKYHVWVGCKINEEGSSYQGSPARSTQKPFSTLPSAEKERVHKANEIVNAFARQQRKNR